MSRSQKVCETCGAKYLPEQQQVHDDRQRCVEVLKHRLSLSQGLNAWRDEAERIGREHGFTEASIAEDIALMHSELSEALEDHRHGEGVRTVWYEEKVEVVVAGETYTRVIKHTSLNRYPRRQDGQFDTSRPYKPCGIPSEIADVIIRALHFCGKHHIDIEHAVREKTNYNETRPPKHGNKIL